MLTWFVCETMFYLFVCVLVLLFLSQNIFVVKFLMLCFYILGYIFEHHFVSTKVPFLIIGTNLIVEFLVTNSFNGLELVLTFITKTPSRHNRGSINVGKHIHSK